MSVGNIIPIHLPHNTVHILPDKDLFDNLEITRKFNTKIFIFTLLLKLACDISVTYYLSHRIFLIQEVLILLSFLHRRPLNE